MGHEFLPRLMFRSTDFRTGTALPKGLSVVGRQKRCSRSHNCNDLRDVAKWVQQLNQQATDAWHLGRRTWALQKIEHTSNT
jgi:hypothetical protein